MVIALGRAIPDLEFITIGRDTFGDIQALGTVVERNDAIGTELPFLVITASAVGDLNGGTIGVVCTETLLSVGAGWQKIE